MHRLSHVACVSLTSHICICLLDQQGKQQQRETGSDSGDGAASSERLHSPPQSTAALGSRSPASACICLLDQQGKQGTAATGKAATAQRPFSSNAEPRRRKAIDTRHKRGRGAQRPLQICRCRNQQSHRRPRRSQNRRVALCASKTEDTDERSSNKNQVSSTVSTNDCTGWHRFALSDCVSTRSTHRTCTCHRDNDRPQQGRLCRTVTSTRAGGLRYCKQELTPDSQNKSIQPTLLSQTNGTGFRATSFPGLYKQAQR
jgi:hypothetical protein